MRENLTHISQVNKNECGVACIYMMLRYFGYSVNYTEIRDCLKLTKNGLSIKEMSEYFSKMEIKTKIYQMKERRLSTYNSTIVKKGQPIIALLNDEGSYHYIVIYEMKNGVIVYSDPAEEKIAKKKNLDLFNRILFLIVPEIKKQSTKKTELHTNFIIKNILEQKREILKITLFSIITSILGIVLSTQFGLFIDTLGLDIDFGFLVLIGVILVFFILLNFVATMISRIKSVVSLKAIKRIEKKISKDLVSNILIQKFSDFNKYSAGEVTSRINDCVAVSMTISNFLLTILSDITITIAGITLLLFIDVYLTGIIIVSLLINAVIINATFRKINDYEHQNMKTYATYYSFLIEVINGFETVKSTCSERFHKKRINKTLDTYERGSFTKEKYLNKVILYLDAITSITSLIVIFIGTIFVRNEVLTLGNLAVFSTITGMLQTIVNRLVTFRFDLENYTVAYNRIIQMFKSNYIADTNKVKAPISSIDIRNTNIAFDDTSILENINIRIDKKNTIIRGESGSGKSSFAKILCGLDNHYTGDIVLNDKYNIRETDLTSIVYLSNNSNLFEGTIKENICLGKTILETRLKQVCEDFCIANIIQKNKLGLETEIVPNQSNLSTGEKQRVALVRAILSEPDILILDEALSNIDGCNKKIILSNIHKYKFKTIFITHEDFELPDCDYFNFERHKVIKQVREESLWTSQKNKTPHLLNA